MNNVNFNAGCDSMKTIGLLGGTGWSSTIGYYRTINELINQRLGGYHSADILLKSIDYHNIMSNYGMDHTVVAHNLKVELQKLLNLNPDCFMICCNSLHKYYDIIKPDLSPEIPILHAVELTAHYLIKQKYFKILLLATKFTMEDGFFAKTLESFGINVVIPTLIQREHMQEIHEALMKDQVTQSARDYFQNLVDQHKNLDAVVLGCTEYPLVFDQRNSALPIVNPAYLQAVAAVGFALTDN